MYNWRKMTEEERKETLELRRQKRHPWHSPPHLQQEGEYYFILTGTCYEHAPIVGGSPARMTELESEILSACETSGVELFAWCVLPNHYHILLKTDQIKTLRKRLAQAHGRTSRKWNLEDGAVGRKVWSNCLERPLQSERHFWASMNYIHHNAVHHGYVDNWQDWPFSSAGQFLETVGRERAAEIWREYPLLDYGKKWDK